MRADAKSMRHAGYFIVLALAGCATSRATSNRTSEAPSRSAVQSAQKPSPLPSESAVDRLEGTDPVVDLNARYERSPAIEQQHGWASYYADSLAGRRMANGQPYNPRLPTMAHRTLDFGTLVRVVRISTGAAVVVRVTDRGPFGSERRVADLSREAARRLDMLRAGVVEVRLEVLGRTAERSRRTVRRK